MKTEMTDREIVSRIVRQGDAAAFSEVVRRYSPVLYSKALGVVKRTDVAQDIVQQAFCKAYQNIDTWRGEHLGSWLTAIAMHLALNHIERERRTVTLDIDSVKAASQQPETPYDAAKEKQLTRLEEVFALLPDADQKLLRLFYFDNRPTADIARKLGMSQSNVLVRLHRLRDKLKKQLSEKQ